MERSTLRPGPAAPRSGRQESYHAAPNNSTEAQALAWASWYALFALSPPKLPTKYDNLTSALARTIFGLAASLRRSALRADAARASTNYFRAATVRTTNAHVHVS